MQKKKHSEHIACVPSHLFRKRENGVQDFELRGEDVVFAQRATLEGNPEYRQILPVVVFVYDGLVWAYRREKTSGESRLVGKVSVSAGGHIDLEDAVFEQSVLNVDLTLKQALERELSEEILLTSKVKKVEVFDKVIAADITPVDRDHFAIVNIYHLDGDGVASNEEQLKGLGFIDPKVLLDPDSGYSVEVWSQMICRFLLDK
ncbi:hypothetical protein [Pseudoalteromonas marina]|uniref:Nudix hydrolase domain-containing protein n=1 Tax=Pseudoalteromonas marina TaxID=267375 RepID=A0ABT9FC09_9GAMM|nr:hypothetical protein [Pseudoalteromonas marina]MDP2564281.1 hypothetical protein [Pseudoalteromonas marina]